MCFVEAAQVFSSYACVADLCFQNTETQGTAVFPLSLHFSNWDSQRLARLKNGNVIFVSRRM